MAVTRRSGVHGRKKVNFDLRPPLISTSSSSVTTTKRVGGRRRKEGSPDRVMSLRKPALKTTSTRQGLRAKDSRKEHLLRAVGLTPKTQKVPQSSAASPSSSKSSPDHSPSRQEENPPKSKFPPKPLMTRAAFRRACAVGDGREHEGPTAQSSAGKRSKGSKDGQGSSVQPVSGRISEAPGPQTRGKRKKSQEEEDDGASTSTTATPGTPHRPVRRRKTVRERDASSHLRPSTSTFPRRNPNWNKAEKGALWRLVKGQEDVLEGAVSAGSPMYERVAREDAWKKVTKALNAQRLGFKRGWFETKRKWQDIKSLAGRKHLAHVEGKGNLEGYHYDEIDRDIVAYYGKGSAGSEPQDNANPASSGKASRGTTACDAPPVVSPSPAPRHSARLSKQRSDKEDR